MRAIGVAGLALLVALSAAAQEKRDKKTPPAPEPAAEIQPREEDIYLPPMPEIEPLGKTVKLTFTLAPEGKGDKGSTLKVVTACTRYAVSARLDSEDQGYAFDVAGNVKLLEGGEILVSCSAWLNRNDSKETSEYSSLGSVVLKPGKAAPVASLGEKTLIIRLEDAPEALE